MMRKAGKLELGEDNTGDAVHDGKARLLLLAADASDNAKKRAESFLRGRRALMVPLPYTKDEISSATGKGGCSMAAVTDFGFADAFLAALSAEDPLKYGELSEEMKKRSEKAAKRKAIGQKSKLGRAKHEQF